MLLFAFLLGTLDTSRMWLAHLLIYIIHFKHCSQRVNCSLTVLSRFMPLDYMVSLNCLLRLVITSNTAWITLNRSDIGQHQKKSTYSLNTSFSLWDTRGCFHFKRAAVFTVPHHLEDWHCTSKCLRSSNFIETRGGHICSTPMHTDRFHTQSRQTQSANNACIPLVTSSLDIAFPFLHTSTIMGCQVFSHC